MPLETVGVPGNVQMPGQMPESERAAVLPLVGLLVEEMLGRPGLDFANPRKLPDKAAAVRQKALAAALVAIAIGGVGLVGAKKSLGRMNDTLQTLQARETDLRKQADQFLILHAKVNHIEQWEQAKVDWLGHVRELSDQLPDPHDAVVDELTGRMSGMAVYDPKGRTYPGGQWSAHEQAVFEVSGKVENRQVTTDLRERLLGGGVYRVESRGPDMADKFSLELLTSEASPIAKETAPSKAVAKAPASKPVAKKPAPTPVTQASDKDKGNAKADETTGGGR